jgi:uncharacterized damage-inducible protein DinB
VIVDVLDRLLRYDAWITRRVLEHCQLLTGEQLHQRFDIGWETVHATLTHIVRNMELWCDLLHGRAPGNTTPDRDDHVLSIDELLARHTAIAEELTIFAQTQARPDNLDATMLDVLASPPVRITYGTVLCDMFHENFVHRSEIRHMLKRLHMPPIEEYDPISWELTTTASQFDVPGDRGSR